MVSGSTDGIDLGEYIATLRQRRWLVLAITVLVISGITIVRLSTTPTYQAAALIKLELESAPPFHSELSARLILDSTEFIEATRERFDPSIPAQTVRERLRIDVRGPMVVRIISHGQTAQGAYQLAEAASETFIRMASRRAEEMAHVIRGRLAEIEEQVARINPALLETQQALKRVGDRERAGSGEPLAARMFLLGAVANWEASRQALLTARYELNTELASLGFPSLIAAPTVPSAPLGANPVPALLLGTIIGLMLGITVASVWGAVLPFLPRRKAERVVSEVSRQNTSGHRIRRGVS